MFPLIPVDSQTGHFGDWGMPFHGLFTLLIHDAQGQDNLVLPGDGNDRSFLMTHNGVRLGYPEWSGRGPHQPPFEPANLNHRKFPNTQNSRLLAIPGHTYTRDPDREDSDDFLGVDYRSFAVVNNNFLGGFANIVLPNPSGAGTNGGWVYPAPDGSRWNMGVVASWSSPDWLSWAITATPYGTLRLPNSFYGVTNVPNVQTGVTAAYTIVLEGASGITDVSKMASVSVKLLDIHNEGAKAIWGFGGGNNLGLYDNYNPTSPGSVRNQTKSVINGDAQRFARGPTLLYETTFSGTPGVDLDMQVVVIRDQQTCAGSVIMNKWEDNPITQHWGGSYGVNCVDDSNPPFIRPDILNICPPGKHEGGGVAQTSLSLTNPATNGPIAASCGWVRILSDGTDVISDPTNEFGNFKWWTFTDQGQDDVFPLWGPASTEYTVGAVVQRNGVMFKVDFAHTSDPNFEPGVGVLWTAKWSLPYDDVNFDIADVNVWAEKTAYSQDDAVREGAADYWLSKGQFTSFDSDPDLEPLQTNHDQPNVGDNFAAFWDGPFNVLLNPVWIADKLILKDWIIESTYTEPAIEVSPTITLARWECLRSHVSVDGSGGNKPGVGIDWPQYWKKAFSTTTTASWDPPTIYEQGAKVSEVVGGDSKQWEAVPSTHIATELNRPSAEDGTWSENVTSTNCRAAVGQLEAALNQVAYHVDNYTSRTESIDFHVQKICAGAMYKDNGSIKIIETDIQYTRELQDVAFDSTWEQENMATPNPPLPDGVGVGHIQRGPATCCETFEYSFRVDGVIQHTVNFSADARASGIDDWTEKYAEYPLTWGPSGTRTLEVFIDGVKTVDLDESFNFESTIEGGATEGKMFDDAVTKASWKNNHFVSGLTFTYIDFPYMNNLKSRLQFGAIERESYAGAGLMNYPGGVVPLGDISNVDQYANPHPFRTDRQIEEGEPFPTLQTLFHGRKLVSPFLYGRKSNSGIALDSQYLNVLRPDDMIWTQWGIYGPDSQATNKVVLDFGSPVNPLVTWIPNAIYGDDIACAYDPITFAIERNSQYRVVYV